MIEAIRLFRRKEDDIWVLYIMEFLKFIGCVVCDCEIREEYGILPDLEDQYDVNIFLNVDYEDAARVIGKELQEDFEEWQRKRTCIFLSHMIFPDMQEILHAEKESGLLQNLIQEIWKDPKDLEEVQLLNEVYSKENLFFYLYNEGNSKFIREHHRSDGIRETIEECYREAAEKSFEHIKAAYSRLYELETSGYKGKPYLSYAKVFVMYKLNEFVKAIDYSTVFKSESLLKRLEELIRSYPDYIRPHYLAGSICRRDRDYYREVEFWFSQAIQKMSKKGLKSLAGFLHYRLGKFKENIWKDISSAKICYKNAYEANKTHYSVLLKLAEWSEEDEERAGYCNQLIGLLLNGYEMDQLMPKQQIFVYDSFVMLGDALRRIPDYRGAIRCYENAVDLAQTPSRFYKAFRDDDVYCFKKIVDACMPVDDVAYKIVRCASEVSDTALAEKYMKMIR